MCIEYKKNLKNAYSQTIWDSHSDQGGLQLFCSATLADSIYVLKCIVSLLHYTLGLWMSRPSTDQLYLPWPVIQNLFNHRVYKFSAIVAMKYAWKAHNWKYILLQCLGYIVSTFIDQGKCQIELGPVINNVQNPLEIPIWKMAHVNEINLLVGKQKW